MPSRSTNQAGVRSSPSENSEAIESATVEVCEDIVAAVGSTLDNTTPVDLAPLTSAPRVCQLCFGDTEIPEMISCSHCSKKVHWDCIKLSKEMVKLLVKYYCKKCRKENGFINEWKLKPGNPPKLTAKRKSELYFDVEAIMDFRNVNDESEGREFLVKWKGYPSSMSTFEPEKHLDGCLNLLQTFCEDNGLNYSNIDGYVGATTASTSKRLNEKNWVKPSEVLRTFYHFNKGTTLITEIWNELRTRDSLYIVPFQSHCYVILHYSSIGLGYIADGENYYATDEKVQYALEQMTGITLVPRLFNQQTGVDHCASSAVVIALEMANHYKLGLKPDTIKVEKQLLQRVKKWFHPEPSKPTKNLWEFPQRIHVCDICDKKFKTAKSLKCHMMIHSNN